MPENDSPLSDTSSASGQYVGVLVGVDQQIAQVSKKFRERHHGNCQEHGRTQIDGKRVRARQFHIQEQSGLASHSLDLQAVKAPLISPLAVQSCESHVSSWHPTSGSLR